MVPLLKDFSWYYSHPILCHSATVLPILFTLNWNLLPFVCQENHQKDHSYGERLFFVQILNSKSILILLNGLYLDDWLYLSGLWTTNSALSSKITVNGYIKLWEYMQFFQDTLCQNKISQDVGICNIKLLLSHCYHSDCNENLKYKDQ